MKTRPLRPDFGGFLRRYEITVMRTYLREVCSIHGESSWASFVCADLLVPHIDGPGPAQLGTISQILPHVPHPVELFHPVLHPSEPGEVLGVVLCPGVELEGNSE